jgi:biofilm PGA synthesis protein PgaD
MSKERHIIDRPELRSPLRSGTELTITALAWALWVYLLMPLLTLILWAAGLRHVFIEEFRLDGMQGLASVAGFYLAGTVLVWLLLEAWSGYNRRRFAGRERRRQSRTASDEEIARRFGVDSATLQAARAARLLAVHFEDDRRARIEPLAEPPPP